jgi:hypothetical protein
MRHHGRRISRNRGGRQVFTISCGLLVNGATIALDRHDIGFVAAQEERFPNA